MEADIVVTENNEGKKLLRKINGRIRKKIVISVAAAIAALAALIVGGIYVYKWMQVNRLVKLKTDEMSFNYMASPYIADDLEYLKRNMPSEILQDIFTGDSNDYLYMTYDMSYDNRSFQVLKSIKSLYPNRENILIISCGRTKLWRMRLEKENLALQMQGL